MERKIDGKYIKLNKRDIRRLNKELKAFNSQIKSENWKYGFQYLLHNEKPTEPLSGAVFLIFVIEVYVAQSNIYIEYQ